MRKTELENVSVQGCCGVTTHETTNKKHDLNELPIVIIGAGPIGLAAAAHLAEKKERFIVLESGEQVGNSILSWGHVRFFSPWEFNIDKAAERLLKKQNWIAPSLTELPTGKELVERYLKPLSLLPEIASNIRLNTKVTAISKKNLDKMKSAEREEANFVVYVERNGETERIPAKAIIDASGTWLTPNPINADSIWSNREKDLQENIFYGIPNIKGIHQQRYANKKVAVVGGGHSAINTLLELSDLNEDTEIYWIMRKKSVQDAYGGEEKDALQARGELGSRIHRLVDEGRVQVITPFQIYDLQKSENGITIFGEMNGEESTIEGVDEIIANTGSRPDFSFLREIRLSIDPATESIEALAPLIDPNVHSCGTVRPHGEEILRQPEKNFYIVGMKSYGRAPTFLMATGYEQVRSVVAYMTGDFESAKNVELELPETGVCGINLESTNKNEACCTMKVGSC